jgi:hypothetical protein
MPYDYIYKWFATTYIYNLLLASKWKDEMHEKLGFIYCHKKAYNFTTNPISNTVLINTLIT